MRSSFQRLSSPPPPLVTARARAPAPPPVLGRGPSPRAQSRVCLALPRSRCAFPRPPPRRRFGRAAPPRAPPRRFGRLPPPTAARRVPRRVPRPRPPARSSTGSASPRRRPGEAPPPSDAHGRGRRSGSGQGRARVERDARRARRAGVRGGTRAISPRSSPAPTSSSSTSATLEHEEWRLVDPRTCRTRSRPERRAPRRRVRGQHQGRVEGAQSRLRDETRAAVDPPNRNLDRDRPDRPDRPRAATWTPSPCARGPPGCTTPRPRVPRGVRAHAERRFPAARSRACGAFRRRSRTRGWRTRARSGARS